MTNFPPLRKNRQLGKLILICLLLVSFASVEAQPCPNLAGGTSTFRFSEPFNETYFPSDLPAGKTGRARSTAGRMIIEETMTTTYPLRTVTINPEFTDGTMGS
ncbi:hypothetical protein, partial [Ravibacter arvi]|uniref:hypothetical protein n=1 Tax=Ravibacter arvi TaxID=2051041 RepID=UPI0031F06F43